MEFGVLGPLEIRSEQTVVRIGAPKLRALLVALLLDAGRVVPTERLVEGIWGEEPPEQALVSLRSYVSNLRRTLADAGPDAPQLVTRGRGYLLDVDPACVDVVRFEQHARAGRGLLADDPDAALAQLDAALGLWRGPALADVAELPVAHAPALRLEELRLAATEDRLAALLATGRCDEVVAEAEALALAHPLRERPRALQMTALYRARRAPEALAVHRAFRALLSEELGLDPSEQLDALADAVLRRDPALDAQVGAAGPAAVGPAPTPAAGAPSRTGEELGRGGVAHESSGGVPATPLLVGRADEQAALHAALARVHDGHGAVVLVAGEPGIGKTALVRWLEARAGDVPVVWGRCAEGGSSAAFWPVTQLLRTLAGAVDDDTLAAELRGPAAGVLHLLPELEHRTGRQADPVAGGGDPHAARFALHEAVLTFLAGRAHARGLVVVVDDLHWADEASLELVGLLADRAVESRLLLVATHRVAAADRSAELDACLAAVARCDDVTTLRLGGLSAPEVREVVAGIGVDAETAAGVHQRAGGNPFFVHQLARLHADAGGQLAEGSVPVGVRHVVLRRLTPLPSEVRTTIDVAAVLGADVDARMLARALDVPLGTALDHLDVAAQHGLLETVDGATTWRFVHALIRDTALDEVPPGRLARLHLAVADALEASPAPHAQRVAEHLWQAADLVDASRPVAWLQAAAEDALAVFAFSQGEQLLRRALHLLAHHEDHATELAVRLRLIQVLTGMHGWASTASAEVALRVRELAGAAGVGPDLVSLWWPLWSQAMTCAQLDEARSSADDLLAGVVRDGTPAALVAGHVAVAYTGIFVGLPHAQVRSHVEAALAVVEDADPASLATTPEHLGVALHITDGLSHALHGDAGPAVAGIRAAVDHAVQVQRCFSEAYARMFGGFAGAALDQPGTVLEFTTHGLVICERLGLPHLANLTLPTHAWACARLGADPSAQAVVARTALEELEATGHRHALPMWWALFGEVLLLADDRDGAVAALDRGTRLAEEIAEVPYAATFARVASLLAVAATS